MKISGTNLKNVAAIVACFAVLTLTSCDESDSPAKVVEVENVTINQPSATALAELTAGGGTITLSVTIVPADATDKSVDWSSSNTAIATVSNAGVVTGVSQGTATISATTKSGSKTAEFPVEVKPDPKAQPVELTSPIRENTTLKDLGLDVDYVFNGNSQLEIGRAHV
jgi:uncharacterized protein YjdB